MSVARRLSRSIKKRYWKLRFIVSGIPDPTVDYNTLVEDKPEDVRLISHEHKDSWILGKFARQMEKSLAQHRYTASIANRGNALASVGHHLSYGAAKQRWSPVETFMITHIDSENNEKIVADACGRYDMGICMSAGTREQLIRLGIPPEKLCYILPAHDAVIRPRPIVVGYSGRVYKDGRKKEDTFVAALQKLPPDEIIIKIMGSGWETKIEELRKSGYTVVYHDAFDLDVYTKEFMPSLDYLVYYTHDEGCMAFLDALAADVKTIVTPQGFHLAIENGIDHPIREAGDITTVIKSILSERSQRTQRVAQLTWDQYTWRHCVVWDYLKQKNEKQLLLDIQKMTQFLHNSSGESGIAEKLASFSVISPQNSEQAIKTAEELSLEALSLFLLRQAVIFYPEAEHFADALRTATATAGHWA